MTDKEFCELERKMFGYSYGSGEEFIMKDVKTFLLIVDEADLYDTKLLSEVLGEHQTWYLINVFCKCDIIEYGTSPRRGWLTKLGDDLAEYVKSKTIDELCEIIERGEDALLQ